MGSAIQMFTLAGLPRGLPAGYGAAPISENERGAVRLCAVVRTTGKGETPLFGFRVFRNGNLHIEFKRPDLLDRLNRIAGGARLRPGDRSAA